MDRRTVLAIALMGGVMFIYQTFLASSPVPPVDQAEQTQSSPAVEELDRSSSETRTYGSTEYETTGGPGETPDNRGLSDTEAGVAMDASRRADVGIAKISASPAVSIDSPLYRTTLDPRGAKLVAWQLTNYTDKEDALVNLATEPGGLMQMSLITDAGRIDLSKIPFEALRMGENVTELKTTTSSGLIVEIRYEFVDEYSVNIDFWAKGTVPGRRNAELEFEFPTPLPDVEKMRQLDERAAAALVMVDDKLHKETVHKKKPGWSNHNEGQIRWAGVRSKYFLAAVIPDEPVAGVFDADVPTTAGSVRTRLRIPISEDPSEAVQFSLFAGPMQHDLLSSRGVGLESAIDLGWKVIHPFSRLLMKCMAFLHRFIPNYGVVILIVSIVTKLAFYPLTRKSMQSMKGLQDLKPEMEKVNERHKDDPQAKQKAIFDLYKEHKVNPVGGCLPMLVQMPIFVALYNVLANSIELRKEPFFLWISDLSVPDNIATIFGMPIHVLPILMGVTMLIQQRLTPSDPRQAALMYIMPIMMLFFFYTLPSGLVLYWTISNVLQIGQQVITNRESRQQLAAA
jgi:YidC/Oxa1 family membrane protein insertase